jgi:hypothetical protein
MGGVDPCRPTADWILRDEASDCLASAAEDASEAARHLRWLAAEWPVAARSDRLRRLALLAETVAAETRAILQEVG